MLLRGRNFWSIIRKKETESRAKTKHIHPILAQIPKETRATAFWRTEL